MYWIVLVAGALLTLVYVLVKIRHNQLATADAVFWFLFALILIVLAYGLASLLGIESPANLVFLAMLVVVIYRLLTLSVENARLKEKLVALTQAVALASVRDEGRD